MPAAYWPAHRIGLGARVDGPEHLGFLGADILGVERHRRLHGRHGEQLKEMIGNHVAQGATLPRSNLPRVLHARYFRPP